MSIIDDILDAVTDRDTGLWDALDATYSAAHGLEQARMRRNGSFGAEKVLRRALDKMESAHRLVADLEEPFSGSFPALMRCFHELDAYRYAAADESQDRYAADHLDYVEDAVRKALAGALDGKPVEAAVAA